MNDLNNKVAIVTGSSREIGKAMPTASFAIATKLAADGANIVVTTFILIAIRPKTYLFLGS